MKHVLDIHDLLIVQLRRLHDAEVQLKPFLKGLLSHVHHENLKVVIADYQNQVNDNYYLLAQVFADLFEGETGEKNIVLRSMEDQTLEMLPTCKTPEVVDAAIVLCLQQIIHFKIASYGAVCTYAKILGIYDDGAKLHQILVNEKRADRFLASLADLQIDRDAYNYQNY